MTWLNAPPVVAQLKTQLKLCASLTTTPFNLSDGQYHYPYAVPTAPNSVLIDAMPYAVLASVEDERERYAEGATGLISGTLSATLYADATQSGINEGVMETLCRQVIQDLWLQYFGIAFKRMRVGTCTSPSPGGRAASNDTPQGMFIQQTITLTYGLSRSK